MAIILTHPMNTQEIRILQEFRRMAKETLTAEAIASIRHPVDPADAAEALVAKGYLTADSDGALTLTQKGKDFLALDVKPEFE